MGNYSVLSRKKALTRVAARTASIIFDYSERICFILFIDTKNTRNNRRRNLGIFREKVFPLAICNQPHFSLHCFFVLIEDLVKYHR